MIYDVAIIGAGVSGLTAASTLNEKGLHTIVLEKARGVSGRLSRRRVPDGQWIDMGAQFFTAEDQEFKQLVEQWKAEALILPWQGELSYFNGQNFEPSKERLRYVAAEGMSSLSKSMAKMSNVETGTKVIGLYQKNALWEIAIEDGRVPYKARNVLLTCPFPQVFDLLSPLNLDPSIEEIAKKIKMRPCLVGLYYFQDKIQMPLTGSFVKDKNIEFFADNYAKTGASNTGTSLSVHGSLEFSEKFLEHETDKVALKLLTELEELLNIELPDPNYTAGHRWRYAQNLVDPKLESKSTFFRRHNLGFCGDWHVGGRVEGAFISGRDLAQKTINSMEP